MTTSDDGEDGMGEQSTERRTTRVREDRVTEVVGITALVAEQTEARAVLR